jgi:hypothetical protein
MSNDKTFDMDAILDGTLDDLADLPEFKNYAPGAHKVIITFEQKKVNNKPCFEVKLTGIETVELADATNEEYGPITTGQEASILFQMDNEFGQGKFKKLLGALASHYGTATNRATIEAANKAEVLVVTTLRPNKDKTKMYMDIDAISVV